MNVLTMSEFNVSAAHHVFSYFAFLADKVNAKHFLVIPFCLELCHVAHNALN